MPKAKSTSQAEQDALNNGMELDPLIDALLEHLPAPGEHWPKEQRQLWLQILELSFQLIYEENPPPSTGDPADEPSTMRQHGGQA